MVFRREVERALRDARHDGRVSSAAFRKVKPVFALDGEKACGFWYEAERRVAACYRRSSDDRDLAEGVRINWSKLKAWLKENALQILSILLALLPLFL